MSTGKIEGKIGHPGMEQGCLSCSLGFISLDTINTIKREREREDMSNLDGQRGKGEEKGI